jgi:hypothetical protein
MLFKAFEISATHLGMTFYLSFDFNKSNMHNGNKTKHIAIIYIRHITVNGETPAIVLASNICAP